MSEQSAVQRVPTGRRSVVVLAVVAVVSLVAGMGLSRLIQSPAQAAANLAPPSAGPITYKVDKRVISNDVPLRAEVRREGSVELKRTREREMLASRRW